MNNKNNNINIKKVMKQEFNLWFIVALGFIGAFFDYYLLKRNPLMEAIQPIADLMIEEIQSKQPINCLENLINETSNINIFPILEQKILEHVETLEKLFIERETGLYSQILAIEKLKVYVEFNASMGLLPEDALQRQKITKVLEILDNVLTIKKKSRSIS